jgi:hypothetical protein
VHELYGLTEEEIRIVSGEVPWKSGQHPGDQLCGTSLAIPLSFCRRSTLLHFG